jgi:hypothetical protein
MFGKKATVCRATIFMPLKNASYGARAILTRVPCLLLVAALAPLYVCRAQEPQPAGPISPQASPQQLPAAPSTKTPAPRGQAAAPAEQVPPFPAPPIEEQVVRNPNAPCLQPPPPVTWRDYQGPYAKTVGIFAQRLERRSVGPAGTPHRHYKPGALLCTLELKDRFWLFVRDSTDPVAFLNAGYNAVVGTVQDSQPTFGHSFPGVLDRFGANMAGQSSAGFFKDFLYPTIFDEDPRYYRLGTGSVHRRMLHAIAHEVVAHNENGNHMFNFSEWLGDASVILLSNTYLPDNQRGVRPLAIGMGNTMGNNAGYDILREFWPEIAKTFRLPFRDQNPPAIVPASTNTSDPALSPPH